MYTYAKHSRTCPIGKAATLCWPPLCQSTVTTCTTKQGAFVTPNHRNSVQRHRRTSACPAAMQRRQLGTWPSGLHLSPCIWLNPDVPHASRAHTLRGDELWGDWLRCRRTPPSTTGSLAAGSGSIILCSTDSFALRVLRFIPLGTPSRSPPYLSSWISGSAHVHRRKSCTALLLTATRSWTLSIARNRQRCELPGLERDSSAPPSLRRTGRLEMLDVTGLPVENKANEISRCTSVHTCTYIVPSRARVQLHYSAGLVQSKTLRLMPL